MASCTLLARSILARSKELVQARSMVLELEQVCSMVLELELVCSMVLVLECSKELELECSKLARSKLAHSNQPSFA